MGFADKIQIFDSEESERINQNWAEQFKRLSDFDWPPQNSGEWTIVLNRAGFSLQRIEQWLAHIGAEGFEESVVGGLPQGYRSTSKDDWPIFSVALMEGLERWRAENPAPTPTEARNKFCFDEWQRGQTYKEINVALSHHPVWEAFEDDLAVRSAINSWAKRIGQSPRKGQPGRRSKA